MKTKTPLTRDFAVASSRAFESRSRSQQIIRPGRREAPSATLSQPVEWRAGRQEAVFRNLAGALGLSSRRLRHRLAEWYPRSRLPPAVAEESP
jgi:hypothetical protein